MLIIALILAVALIFGLIWLIYRITTKFARREQELIEKLHSVEQEKEQILQASRKAIDYCLQYNKKCIESHTRTLQALRSKHTKAIDMAIERGKLNERSKKRLEKKWQELEDKVLQEIQSTMLIEDIAKEILEKVKKESEGRKQK